MTYDDSRINSETLARLKKELAFNFLWDQSGTIKSTFISAHNGQCPVICLEKLVSTDFSFVEHIPHPHPEEGTKQYYPAIQMFNSGFRMSGLAEHPDYWRFWNGCVYVDLDTKNFKSTEPFNNEGISKSQKFFDNFHGIFRSICEKLRSFYDYRTTFLFGQISHSGTSAHLVFYYDCDKNEDNYRKACTAARLAVCEILRHLISFADEIIAWPGVMDDCSNNPHQLMFLSNNPIEFNGDCCTGFYNLTAIPFEERHTKTREQDVRIVASSKATAKYNPSSKNITDGNGTLVWHYGWRKDLYNIFSKFFEKDEETAFKTFVPFVPWLTKNYNSGTAVKDHKTEDYFKKEFQMTYRKFLHSSIDYHASMKVWKFVQDRFGLKFTNMLKYEPKRLTMRIYDKEYSLSKDEYISKYFREIIEDPNPDHKNIYIEAGCGLGKTRAVREYGCSGGIQDMSGDMFNLEATSNKRICFVTPMTSINRNNFDGDESVMKHWAVIDSNHKGNSERLNHVEYNICTTWDSFVKYDMQVSNFGIYVFDEIHNVFMYDYRTEIISTLLQYVSMLLSDVSKKVVFMSGTPGPEWNMKPMWHVRVKKPVIPIKVRINFYNVSFMAGMVKDIKEYLSCDKNRTAIVMHDKSSVVKKENLEKHDLKVKMLYVKKNVNAVHSVDVTDENIPSGGVCMFSVYGQAGISLRATDGQRLKIYVVGENAQGIIQYMNRVRNTESVDGVELYFKRGNITNELSNIRLVDLSDARRKVEVLNRLGAAASDWYIKTSLGLNEQVLYSVSGKYVLNENFYKVWKAIRNNIENESTISAIYNRLIDAGCKVSFNYWLSDPKSEKRHCRGAFTDIITSIDVSRIKFSDDGSVRLSMSDRERMYLNGKVGEAWRYAINCLSKEYFSDCARRGVAASENDCKEYIESMSKEWLSMLLEGDEIKKSSVCDLGEALWFRDHIGEMGDEKFMKQIWLSVNATGAVSKNNACVWGALHAAMNWTFGMKDGEVWSMAVDGYRRILHLGEIIKKFDWLVDWSKLSEKNDLVLSKDYSKEMFTNLYRKLHYKFCESNKKDGRRIRACIENGAPSRDFESIEEAANMLKVDRRTIQRLLKSGNVSKKLKLKFMYIDA